MVMVGSVNIRGRFSQGLTSADKEANILLSQTPLRHGDKSLRNPQAFDCRLIALSACTTTSGIRLRTDVADGALPAS